MSLFGIASSFATFVRTRVTRDKAVTETFDFKFHYRLTTAFLFLSCVLCSTYTLIGNPITCIVRPDEYKAVVESFCWVTSTYTVPVLKGGHVGKHVAAPFVGHYNLYEDKVMHHNYYQWVPFALFFQGLMFYLPHYVWKLWEGGLAQTITEDLRGPCVDDRETRAQKTERLCRYLTNPERSHLGYGVCYLFCVTLNLLNTIANIFLIDALLGGTFLTYGTKVAQMSGEEFRRDGLSEVFPKITKCLFYSYGPSGTITTIDALCVLALNVLNEKIYVFLWFWLIVLAVVSSLALFYTLAIMFAAPAKDFVLKNLFKVTSPVARQRVVERLDAGDFLLLHFLGQNITGPAFVDLVKQLAECLDPLGKQANQPPEMSHMYPTMVMSPPADAMRQAPAYGINKPT